MTSVRPAAECGRRSSGPPSRGTSPPRHRTFLYFALQPRLHHLCGALYILDCDVETRQWSTVYTAMMINAGCLSLPTLCARTWPLAPLLISTRPRQAGSPHMSTIGATPDKQTRPQFCETITTRSSRPTEGGVVSLWIKDNMDTFLHNPFEMIWYVLW